MQKKLFKTLKPSMPSTAFLSVSDYQFNDRISNLCFISTFLLIVLNIILIWVNFEQLPPEVPLFLQNLWGNGQLAEKNLLWLQPGLVVVFFLINYALSLLTMKVEPLVARIMGGAVLICSVMSLISVWNIINLTVIVRYWF